MGPDNVCVSSAEYCWFLCCLCGPRQGPKNIIVHCYDNAAGGNQLWQQSIPIMYLNLNINKSNKNITINMLHAKKIRNIFKLMKLPYIQINAHPLHSSMHHFMRDNLNDSKLLVKIRVRFVGGRGGFSPSLVCCIPPHV